MRLTFKSFCSRWISLSLAVLMPLSMAGCSFAKTQPEPIRMGVTVYDQEDTFIASLTQSLQQNAQAAEVEYGVKINVSIADGKGNQTTQMEQVDGFIKQGCDVICVNVVDRTAAAVLIDKAKEAQIPLLFFNREPVEEDLRRWEQVVYIGAKAEQSGVIQGRMVVQAWQEEPERWDKNGDGILQYVLLEGEPGHQDALLRTEYAAKGMTAEGLSAQKLAGDTANWNRGQAMSKMSLWLDTYGEQIEAVISNNDDMALGAIDAFLEREMEVPLVVGVDATQQALEAIREGTLYGTVHNDAKGIAQALLELCLVYSGTLDASQAPALEKEHYLWFSYEGITAAQLDDWQEE